MGFNRIYNFLLKRQVGLLGRPNLPETANGFHCGIEH